MGQLTGSGTIHFYGMGEIKKYWAADYAAHGPAAVPFEVKQTGPNRVMFGGGSAMWQALMGDWGGGFWDDGSMLGVGNSGNVPDQTDNALHGLQQFFKEMDDTYPQHTDGFTTDALDIVFRSTFEADDANFHWREWAVFNSGMSRMLNRKNDDNGTKTDDMVWEFTVTLRLEC